LHDEIVRLTRLVGDLETLAAADAARLTMRHEPVDLADVAARAAASVQTPAVDADLDVHTEFTTAPVQGDPDRLHQVALNLLSNAIKFTPPGGRVTVTTRARDGIAELLVDDNGPGVPPDETAHLFERFSQGELGKAAGGSGIGLAVATELATAHGGTLTVDSNAAGGARFTLRLPRSTPAG
ncbi:sensor histidine kinase, partial [Euzebya sp.]|uniref:sensor histidine kinase n=1 Tax=Euzebya sp. TaxID=1971409 RepID=UPI0035130779